MYLLIIHKDKYNQIKDKKQEILKELKDIIDIIPCPDSFTRELGITYSNGMLVDYNDINSKIPHKILELKLFS